MDPSLEPHHVVVLVLPDLTTAERARADLRRAVDSGRFRTEDCVLAEHVRGKVRLHQSSDAGALKGLGQGALLGGLAGLFFGTVAAPALLVGAAGAAVAALHDGGIPDHLASEIGEALRGGSVAMLVLADANSARMIADETFAGSTVHHLTLRPDDAAAVHAAAAEVAEVLHPW